jgi:hypothetical protein
VITKHEISKDRVSVGSKVRVRNMDAGKTFEYHIVGSAEANPTENKLSNESPVGKAIIGHKKGDVVEVSAPRGALLEAGVAREPDVPAVLLTNSEQNLRFYERHGFEVVLDEPMPHGLPTWAMVRQPSG